MAREHGRLPYLAFLNLSVSQKRVYTIGITAQLSRQGHAHGRGNPLPQGAARHVHARDMLHIRMSLQIGAGVAQRQQILFREIAALR